MNIMIGRLWLVWCRSWKSRPGGIAWVDTDDGIKPSFVWTKIGPIQVTVYTQYANLAEKYVRVLRRKTKPVVA